MRTPAKVALALTLAIGTLGTTAIVAAAGSGGGSAPGSRGGAPSVPIALDPVVPGPCGLAVTSGSGPDGTVSYTPCPGEDPSPADPVPVSLEPTPGMDNVHTIGWDTSTLSDGGTSVTLTFYTGVAPCSVLDHVDVSYGTDAVTITLYQGSDPSSKDVACIDIAMLASTTVKLDQPLGDRKILDGAGD